MGCAGQRPDSARRRRVDDMGRRMRCWAFMGVVCSLRMLQSPRLAS